MFHLTTPVASVHAASNKLAPEIEPDMVRVVTSHGLELPVREVPLTVPTRSSEAKGAEFTNLTEMITRDQQRERDMRQLQACQNPSALDPSDFRCVWCLPPERALGLPCVHRAAIREHTWEQPPTPHRSDMQEPHAVCRRLATRHRVATAAAVALLLCC